MEVEIYNKFKSTLTTIPSLTGVYQMFDSKGNILYIGKAKNLKSRVSSYFRDDHYDRPQIPIMLKKLDKIEWIITENETEALVLESNLIKHHQPPYNICLRDDKHYPYVKISTYETFPRVLIVRKVEDDRALYFGPFTDARNITTVVTLLRKLFKIRSCKMTIELDTNKRACIDYSMGLCSAPCNQNVTVSDYMVGIEQIKNFFLGRRKEIVLILEKRMKEASAQLRFEEAAIYRDQIREIKKLNIRQGVDLRKPNLNCDVFGLFRGGNHFVLSVMVVRRGVIINHNKQIFRVREIDNESFGKLIVDYYTRSVDEIPQEIIVSALFENDRYLIEEWLQKENKNISVVIPKRGDKLRLLEKAEKDGKLYISQKYLTDGPKLLKELAERCNLPKVPSTIEAFDISNLGDRFTVAGMVHFRDGVPDKSHYRRFKIKSVSGQNDFAMMMEAVTRRLNRLKDEGKPFPDLLLIDGGKGQLSATREALKIYDTPPMLISLAKKEELVFSYYTDDPIQFGEGHPVRRLLERIRNEVHHFAITYHRKIRGRQYQKSILEEVKGIGPKKSTLLLKQFGSAEAVYKAPTDDLLAISSISEKDVTNIKEELSQIF